MVHLMHHKRHAMPGDWFQWDARGRDVLTQPDQFDVADRKRELPPFAALRAFDALIREGGVRKAARSLELHHSVISRHLTCLESWLGIALLQWSGKSFTLTQEGERFYSRVSSAIAEIVLATDEALGMAASRPLKVWCSHGLSIQWLASQIAKFERQHPQMRIELRPSDVPANLHVHEADVNIFMHLENEMVVGPAGGLKSHVLARPRSMIAASPTLVAELSWIKSAADLLNVPMLHGGHTRDWRWWLKSHGVDTPDELPGELCWHPHMALEACRLGRGILLANRFFFERDLDRGDLVELLVPGTTSRPFGGYLFVCREDRWSSSALSTFRQFLARQMKTLEE